MSSDLESDNDQLLNGRLLMWRGERHKQQKKILEEILERVPPEPVEVEQLLVLRDQFKEVRNIIDYYLSKGENPRLDAFEIAVSFKNELVEKEQKLETYFSNSFATYRSIADKPGLTVEEFKIAREQFEQVRKLAERYDPSRKGELEALAESVQKRVSERFLSGGGASFFSVPQEEHDEAYHTLKKEYEKLHQLLNTRAYQPDKRGAYKRIDALIQELHPIAIKAKGYDFASDVNDTLVKAYELERECLSDEHHKFWRRALFGLAGLSALVVGMVGVYRLDRQSEILERLTRANASIVEAYSGKELSEIRKGGRTTVAGISIGEEKELEELKKRVEELSERARNSGSPNTPNNTPNNIFLPGKRREYNVSVKERTVQRIMAEENPEWILYVSVKNHEGELYDTSRGEPRLLYKAPCTLGKVPGNKRRSGDHRTQQGVFGVDQAVVGHFEPLYGDAFMNLEDKPYPGLQVTGTGLSERVRAIEEGKDSTNGAVSFRNKDAIRFTEYAIRHGLKNGLVVIQDEDNPIR